MVLQTCSTSKKPAGKLTYVIGGQSHAFSVTHWWPVTGVFCHLHASSGRKKRTKGLSQRERESFSLIICLWFFYKLQLQFLHLYIHTYLHTYIPLNHTISYTLWKNSITAHFCDDHGNTEPCIYYARCRLCYCLGLCGGFEE